ncbi:Small-conductance mechanosensitive channel [hydrothermal vent metagenome]|uniref:Small-conductance mechanosensitive channel n=1 Tax=hydrothermal vent metagenome TaxID=652676 RepID=A0A3B1D8J2_9ZZZZ
MFNELQTLLQGLGFSLAAAGGSIFILKVAVIFILSFLSNIIAKRLIVRSLHSIIYKTENKWDDIFAEKKVFELLSHIAPAWVIYAGVFILFPQSDIFIIWIQRFAVVYMIVVGVMVVNSLLTVAEEIYRTFAVSRRRPIKGYLQVFKIGLYFLCIIFVIATLLNKSPWGLLSILGGLTAVLILVFRDTILGFVAGIQLMANNMVSRGDWIEMPDFGADGEVLEITINTVKVQNWDKTITTIPTYALISRSFKNWEGMSRCGGRRIKRVVCIDMNTIKFCTPQMISKFKRFDYLKKYIDSKEKDITQANQENGVDVSELVNGRRMTNVGTFRAYIVEYLKHHPKIHKNMTFLVRHLKPTENGLPIEIYVFSNDQVWANYEAIQADIFDHILAVLPEFELRVFQRPSGSDFQKIMQS